MAFYLQYRNLCKRVKQQLDGFNDQEKARLEPSDHHQHNHHRFSGATTTAGQDDNVGKDSASEDGEDAKNFPYAALDGVTLETDPQGQKYYQVGFESAEDPQNPKNWSLVNRLRTVFVLITIAFVVTAASSIDSAIAPQAAQAFGVSSVTEALGGTGIFLVGFGIGSLLASPASEMVGRYPVYLVTLVIFGCWLVGAGLAPNIGAQIAFRFLAGLFASAPLTVAGGSIADMFSIKERTWVFPAFALIAFGGPVLGPVIAAYIGKTGVLSWRWVSWIMLITDGLVIALILLLKRETLAPQILRYKAKHLRTLTGDDRFKTAMEAEGHSFAKVLKTNFTRPFILAKEPIILLFTLYLTVVYIILFTFLDGYTYIFEQTYGISAGVSDLCFLGLLVGIVSNVVIVPIVNRITKKQLARDGDDGSGSALNQETRIIFSMVSAPFIPIGLLWMAWTDYVSNPPPFRAGLAVPNRTVANSFRQSSVSIWAPIVGSVVVGFGIIGIFTSAYLYIIDSYHVYAASALTFVTLVRYLAAGGM